MTNEEWNTTLYKKLFAEQESFKDWLLTQPPEEILQHSYEYTLRQDIVLAMEEHDLSDAQCQALLDSPTPLSDLFYAFEKIETGYMEDIYNCMEDRANTVISRKLEEQQAYRDCKTAMEAAIGGNYHDNRLDTKTAWQEVVSQFGTERPLAILAHTIREKEWDGRISRENKAWAKSFPLTEGMKPNLILDNAHTGLVDLFCTQARKGLRSSLKEKLHQTVKPIEKNPTPKRKPEPER